MKLIEEVRTKDEVFWDATSHLQGEMRWFYGVGYVCPPASDSAQQSTKVQVDVQFKQRYGETQLPKGGKYTVTLPYLVEEDKGRIVDYSSARSWDAAGVKTDYSCGESTMTFRQRILVPGRGVADLTSVIESLQHSVRARLVQKISAQEVSLPTTILEARDTQELLLETARKLKLVFKAARRGDLIGALRHLGYTRPPPKLNRQFKHRRRDGKKLTFDDALNNWLALRYGWQPLLSDIYSILVQIEKDFMSEREVLHRSRTSQFGDFASKHESAQADGTIGQYLFSCGFQNSWDEDTRVTCEAWASYRETSRLMRFLHEWGILNPASVAWDLLPLSFVADWVVNVGGWLSSLNYAVGLELADAGMGTTVTTLKTGILRDNWTQKKHPYFTQYMSYSRIRFDSFESIVPSFLRLNDKVNWKHLVDAVALLRAFAK